MLSLSHSFATDALAKSPRTCQEERLRSLLVMLSRFVLIVALLPFSIAVRAQGKGETVRIQDYPGLGDLPIRVAIAKGYCTKFGIKCELQMIPNAPLGIQAVLAKSIEGTVLVPEAVLPAIDKGVKLKGIAGMFTRSIALIAVGKDVATPNAGKPFPVWVRDMKGKRIGVTARGSGVETATRFMLKKAGVSPDDVTFVAVGGPATAYQALVNKQVDFIFSFEPVGTMCDVTKQCRVVYRGDVDREPAELYAVNGGGAILWLTQDYIDAHPDVVDALIKASVDAGKFIRDPKNFDEVLAITEKFFKFQMPHGDEIMRRLLRRQIKVGNYDIHISRRAVKASIDWMRMTGQWNKSVNVASLIDSRAP
jgi:NitT/TauT family transport system substrate-binding protein